MGILKANFKQRFPSTNSSFWQAFLSPAPRPEARQGRETRQLYLGLLGLAALMMTGCSPVSRSSAIAESAYPYCSSAALDPDGDGWGWEDEKSCRMPVVGKAETPQNAVYEQELRVLEQESPLELSNAFIFEDFGYPEFPRKIFARKGGKLTPEDRLKEKTPPGTNDSAAHRFLMRLGQQMFQQALLFRLKGDPKRADNVLRLMRSITDAQLAFQNDPTQLQEVNDNRYLEMGWFLALAARGVHIINVSAPQDWKQNRSWDQALGAFQSWLGPGIDQNWPMSDALNKQALDLVAQAGTMNWVGSIDNQYGATNRTFALLEAQLRVAELRGGNLGPMRLQSYPSRARSRALLQEGTIGNIFSVFRVYLRYYFNKPLTKDPNEYTLTYAPGRTFVNTDPEVLNEENCGDPLKLGWSAPCLLNKDAYRRDTYHPLMGFASIMHIIDIGKRAGYELTPEEQDKVIKGLRWACFNNVDGVTGRSSRAIPVWEMAFRFYPAEALGPYCKRDLEADRAQDKNKRASLAWGYTVLSQGF